MFGFGKDLDYIATTPVMTDKGIIHVNCETWDHIRSLERKIEDLRRDKMLAEGELANLNPILAAKEYKPAIGKDCVDCKYVVLNRFNNQPVGCRKDNVCGDFVPIELSGVREED